jgi:hypothetical protein
MVPCSPPIFVQLAVTVIISFPSRSSLPVPHVREYYLKTKKSLFGRQEIKKAREAGFTQNHRTSIVLVIKRTQNASVSSSDSTRPINNRSYRQYSNELINDTRFSLQTCQLPNVSDVFTVSIQYGAFERLFLCSAAAHNSLWSRS